MTNSSQFGDGQAPHSFLPHEEGAKYRQSAATRSVFDRVVVPCAALLMTNIMIYAAAASFAIRPNIGTRLLPVVGFFFLGTWLGGAVFPRLLAWAARTNSPLRRVALAAWLLASLVTVLPGFQHYAFNEPLRCIANLTLGMAIAPAYQLFFSRFPPAWRGTCFGACLAAGLLCWSILGSLAHAWPVPEGSRFHPFLPYVFAVHATAIAILAALTVRALVLQPQTMGEEKPYFAPPRGKGDRRSLVRLLLLSAFTIYLLSGIVGARLTPVFPTPSRQVLHIILTILAIIAAPAAGWLLDKRLERLFRHVLPVCCCLFVLTPSLTALGYEHSLHSVLQPVAAAAQFVFFVVCSVVIAGVAPTAGLAVWYACCVYGMRTITTLGYFIESQGSPLAPGTVVLIASVLALFAGMLLRRVDFTVDVPDENSKHVPEIEPITAAPANNPAILSIDQEKQLSPEVPVMNDGITKPQKFEELFAHYKLSPREREVAVLWLRGTSVRDMAARLTITESTVKAHVKKILAKSGVANRTAFLVKLLNQNDKKSAG